MTRWLISAALATLLAGCTAGAPDQCENPEPGVAELGLGDLDSGYVPATDGGDVRVVLGPQGLHMIVVSVRVWQLEAPPAGEPCHLGVAIDHDQQLVGGAIADVMPVAGAGGATDFLGLRTTFQISDVRALDGELVQLVANVTDGCGRSIQATRTLRLYF